jgi:hypothetical protein
MGARVILMSHGFRPMSRSIAGSGAATRVTFTVVALMAVACAPSGPTASAAGAPMDSADDEFSR